MFHEWLNETDGATAIEYALVASMFALMVLTGFTYLAGEVEDGYTNAAEQVDQAGP